MRSVVLLLIALSTLLADGQASVALAQTSDARPHIEWEVKNRFRLFRSERDFQRHVASWRNDGILASERRLARDSDGRGWARDTVERLCVDRAGRLTEFCERDGTREHYLAPGDHRVGAVLAGAVPDNVSCTWTFQDADSEPRQATVACDEEVRLRVAYGKPTSVSVDIALPDGTAQRVVTEIAVRDLLIAGMGDSIAAGEGNPDRPVRLSDGGFCFRRFLGSEASEYYRPGRAGYGGNRSCVVDGADQRVSEWQRQSARWHSGPCHRSLYSYQMRAALGLAIENPHLAVTFIPLACSGATIATGFLGPQTISECPNPGTSTPCATTTRAQMVGLTEALAIARKRSADRSLDLVLLTIGANDIKFAGLVADVIIEARTERVLFGRGGHIATVAESQAILDRSLPNDFLKVRAALKPLLGGDLSRVVFVSYGHPALAAPGRSCPGGRAGFDVHPAFGADPQRLHRVVEFVSNQFLPKIEAIARCQGKLCSDPARDRMTFVDAHQADFAHHGVCARAADDPEFDQACFSVEGNSFRTDPEAANDPLACGWAANEYRPYAPRARWVRTANDSYFTAMTYPQGLPATMQPASLHDAAWGVFSAVYGGAVHPTAEGHAAMADAALATMRQVLGIAGPEPAVHTAPLPLPSVDGQRFGPVSR
jgi:lysophospholipase L1-like esterase